MRRKIRRLWNVFVVLVVLSFSGCQKAAGEEKLLEVTEEDLDDVGVEEEISEDTKSIFVHVCGQVSSPGVYELAEGCRIYEALAAAGGMTEEAAEESLNQAQILTDGQQLYVPSEEEMLSEERTGGSSKVNINQATKEELMNLSGIGESKAEAIIKYREQTGGFRSIEEIMEIEGIKEGVFRKIEDEITVS